MPFGKKKDGNGNEVDLDVVYKHIIKKAIEQAGLEPLRSDDVEGPGSIYNDMLDHVINDPIAIVDITTLNPNVFYELGVRHALRKNVTVLIRKEGTETPFNIAGMRVIKYDVTLEAAARAIDAIAASIKAGLSDRNRSDSRVRDVFPELQIERLP